MNELHCHKCGAEMPFFPSDENSVTDGINYCIERSCELFEMQQPQETGESFSCFGSDGSVTVIRKGPFSTNEGNLDIIRNYLNKHLPAESTASVLTNKVESGADLTVKCNACNSTFDIQVTRVLDSAYAMSSRQSDVTWKKYTALEIAERLEGSIKAKSVHYSPTDTASMVLVLDPTVDVFWSVFLCMDMDKLRDYLSGSGWLSVIMISPTQVVRLAGSGIDSWCNC